LARTPMAALRAGTNPEAMRSLMVRCFTGRYRQGREAPGANSRAANPPPVRLSTLTIGRMAAGLEEIRPSDSVCTLLILILILILIWFVRQGVD
jgi:hypothetical protein